MKRIATIILLLAFAVAPVYADERLPDDALMCQNVFGPFVKVNEEMVEDGLMEESFAHEEDGPVIVKTLSNYKIANDYNPLGGPLEYSLGLPLFYIIDLDSDGTPDRMLVNRTDQQKCSVLESFNQEDAIQEQSDVKVGI